MEAQTAEVTAVRRFDERHTVLVVQSEALAKEAEPGQFLQLKIAGVGAGYLRRPFSFGPIRAELGEFELFIQAVGEVSGRLCALEPGAELEVLGPLGKPFPEVEAERVLLVGGGTGAAPLVALAYKWHRADKAVKLLLGAKTASALLGLASAEAAGVEVAVATEDGSAGVRGLVTELLEPADAFCACGPIPLMQKVAQYAAELQKPCYVSLEARMACGFGVCAGCAVPVKRRGKVEYAKACLDGPVFEAEEVAWDELARVG